MSFIKTAQLLRKEIGLAAGLAAKEGIRLPKGTTCFDIAKVKKNDIITDIFTFKDENGKMIQRFIKKTEGTNVTETTRKYDELESFDVPVDKFCFEHLLANAKRIRSYTRTNGKISEIKQEVITHTNETNPYMTKTVRSVKPEESNLLFHRKPNLESVSIEQRRNSLSPVFIKNEYLVDNLAPGNAVLQKSEVSSPELKDIANNSFFLPYTSPDVKFVHRMAQACINDSKLLKAPKVKLYKKIGKQLGRTDFTGRIVKINIMSEEGMMEPRTSLVNTVGHEVGHAKWGQKMMRHLELAQSRDFKTMFEEFTAQEIAQVALYRKSLNNYTAPGENYSKYYHNYTEVTAREEGTAVSKKFAELIANIEEFFRFMHPEQFSVQKYNVRTESLYELCKNWGLKSSLLKLKKSNK